MAVLIGLPDAQSFVVNGNSTMLPYFSTLVGVWGLINPHTSDHVSGTGEGLLNDAEGLALMVRRQAAPVGVTSNQVHFLVKHQCTCG